MIGVSFTGTDRLKSRYKAVSSGARKVGPGLSRFAKIVMEDSRENYCPVDTGHLKSTGFVDEPIIQGGETSVSMGYSAVYAVHVHEIPARHWNGKTWKYLSIPFRKHLEKLAPLIKTTWFSFIERGA